MLPTADISDKYSDSVRILKPLFRDYGGVKSFSGKVKIFTLPLKDLTPP